MSSQRLVKKSLDLIKILFAGILLISLVNCAVSGVKLNDVNFSLSEIKKGVVKALPVNINYASNDSRNFKSVHFVRYGKKLKLATNEKERAFAEIFVRGIERPYTLEILVTVEEAVTPDAIEKNFKVIGYDERIAKIILARLKAYLNKRRDDSNLVDDFRVF